jgi:hypothetical protein
MAIQVKPLLLPLALLAACQPVGQKESLDWQPAPASIMTRWAEQVDPANPHPEYPRPQMVRKDWMNLNGLWEYAVTPVDEPKPEQWEGKILVPFPLESALSGVGRILKPDEALWYRREFEVPADWAGKMVLLHFEAVDWQAEAWLNGARLGDHRGGYDPFSFVLNSFLREGVNELILKVTDPTDTGTQPRGKQVLNPGGIFYTPVSGIWQTAWLEAVHSGHHIESFHLETDTGEGEIRIMPKVFGFSTDDLRLYVEVINGGKVISHRRSPLTDTISLSIPNPELWSPGNPFLYDLRLTLLEVDTPIDVVEGYFGMRKISIGKDAQGITRILLNDEFLFQNGMLDQGFFPDGIYTPATDAALKNDVESAKNWGFNMLRKHVKVELRRYYYWCDKLGVLVWQDMPSGDKYIGPADADLKRSQASARQYEAELEAMIERLYNHPSIIVWVPFNEGWGQYDTERITRLIAQQDPTRLVNSASGWTDRGTGHILDIHNYPDPKMPPLEENRAIVLGEFGGLGKAIPGHTWEEKNWGYQQMADRQELALKYEEFYVRVWEYAEKGLSAAIYTQITDVETETNGLVTYDRKVLKIEHGLLKKINTGNFVASPRFSHPGGLFNKPVSLEISQFKGLPVYYTTDGSEPGIESRKYFKPLSIEKSVKVQAAAIDKSGARSQTVSVEFKHTSQPEPVYRLPFSEKYRAGGVFGLVDGQKGSASFGDGRWQGFEGIDLDVTIAFEKPEAANSISVNFLQDQGAWVFLPKKVLIQVSDDGKVFQTVKETVFPVKEDAQVRIETVKATLDRSEMPEYIKVIAENAGPLPQWHPGAGGKAWMFVDEVE